MARRGTIIRKLFFLFLFFFLFGCFLCFFKKEKVIANDGEISITVDPQKVKNDDFAQILGGYVDSRSSLSPYSKFTLSFPSLINEAKKMFPQPPEFSNPAVIRTKNNEMKTGDCFVLTDEEVEDIIKFCRQAGCDPMFGAVGEGPVQTCEIWGEEVRGKITDTSYEAIKKRATFVKTKCQEYFGDDKHCLHWDVGNEPSTVPSVCLGFGKNYLPTAIRAIKEVIPNAIIHTPELFSDSAQVRDSEETVGECIIRNLEQTDPTLKVDVVTTHWYPYICSGSPTALNVDGNAVLKWDGFGGPAYEKMTYSYDIVAGMSDWMRKYNVSKNAVIGLGELNPMAGCFRDPEKTDGSQTTLKVNLTWGGAFWHLDVLGIAAEAGVKYIQKHVLIGGAAPQYVAIQVANGQVIKFPSYYAYRFYSQYFGKTIVESRSSDPPTVNSHASVDKDKNLRIILINKSGSGFKPGTENPPPAVPKKVKISIVNFEAEDKGEAYLLTAPHDFKYYSDVLPPVDENEIYKTQSNIPVGNNFEYTVPPYSAVIIKVPCHVTPTPTPQATAIPCSCPSDPTRKSRGDANCDGKIDEVDFNLWLEQFHSSPSQTDSADFNCDGKVDGIDFEYWRREKDKF